MKVKTVALILLGLLVFVSGCAGLRVADYERIEKGMSKEEVEAVLGEPWVEAPKLYFYQGEGLVNATIFFNEEGKVVEKKWDDGIYE